jgi:hypothetical protein
MKKTIIIVLIALAAYIAIFYFLRNMKRKTYLDYLHSLGFGVADKMTTSELADSYNYLFNYARKYASNAAGLVMKNDPALYSRLQRIVSKYGALFNLNPATADTNIPNIHIAAGVTPIPNVYVPSASNPANSGNNIIPPTLNIV